MNHFKILQMTQHLKLNKLLNLCLKVLITINNLRNIKNSINNSEKAFIEIIQVPIMFSYLLFQFNKNKDRIIENIKVLIMFNKFPFQSNKMKNQE